MLQSLYYSKTHGTNGISISLAQSIQASSYFSCLMPAESHWHKVSHSDQPTSVGGRRFHLVAATSCIRPTLEIIFYIYDVNNFQIMIVNCSSMKCRGHGENVHLQIGQYNLQYNMFFVDMGGCDIVLSVEWLCTLCPITMDFKDLTMKFQQEGQ
jgi:hypothetical protein